ncbi:microtubule-associated protein futsch-like isoform X3 [Ruditapes philippinarum]|uniref:microtubule-associated protein futsch-like isoform X3 n=1 Tax=Ruditapes philippinarum TaxID=129788 RepID=UPI00295BB40B|nr:microtubule-associated protein futsch-like isoform X3 [Ruditapes philippinarum]
MIPVLSCMQLAASMTGTGSGEEKTCPDEGPEKNLTEANGTSNSDGLLQTELAVDIDCQNNNQEKVVEEIEEPDVQSDVVQSDVVTKTSEKNNSVIVETCVDDGQPANELEQQDKPESVNGTKVVNDTPDSDVDEVINKSENNKECNSVTEEQIIVDDSETILNEHHKATEDIDDNFVTEEVIKPKKTSLSTFLSKSYFDEESILKFGSVDIADDAHIQLEILHEKTKGKSWDDELKETVETHANDIQVEVDSDLEYIEEKPLEKNQINDTNITPQQQTKENDPEINEQEDDDIRLDDKTEVRLDKKNLQEDNFQNNETDSEVNANEVIEKTIVKEKRVDELCENLHVSETDKDILTGVSTISGATGKPEHNKDKINEEVQFEAVARDDIDGNKEVTDENNASVNGESNSESKGHIDNSDYDADTSDSESENIERLDKVNNANSSDSETERIERTNELKAALLSCLKYKRETFEKSDSTNSEKEMSEQFESVRRETFESYTNKDNRNDPEIDINDEDKQELSENQNSELDSKTEYIRMPETRDNMDGCVSPSMMFASCRYRWEKSILTQSPSVVFVTLNNKEVEPIKLEWSESSRCFYSEEIKIPVGVYIGNLVVDGTFYPVEDIVMKHYTFEVDLYLKDDILEDEGQSSGVVKAEEFIKQKQQGSSQEPEKLNRDFTYTPNRASGYTYSSARSNMDAETTDQAIPEGSINATSKYQELLRSQMTQNKGALNDNDLDSGVPSKTDFTDLGGRRTPVGEDGDKQYQDGDTASQKSLGREDNLSNGTNGQTVTKYNTTLDDFFEQRNHHSNGSIQNGFDAGERTTPPAVIDDVLGNGHSRTPIYSTESPVYSKHSSAHSSARQTPTATEAFEQGRPESVGSTHSANSLSKQVLDDLVSDALGRPRASRSFPSPEPTREGSRPSSTPTRPESVGSAHSENSLSRRAINDIIEDSLNITKTPPPSRESSLHGSRPRTPPSQEQIDDVLNPADRHSPIRREFLAGSPSLSNHSGKSSKSSHSSAHSSAQNSAHSSQRQTPQRDIISNSLKASQEKLYSGLGSGSNASSRPQSLTSEQELTQYYENLADTKSGSNTDILGSAGPRTGSAASLPAIGSQQRYTPDKRSMTPDNHIRVPVVGSINKPSLLPSRTPPRTPISNASSRTVTPMNAETDNELRYREQVKDLESTISNLRTLLSSRENEVAELKDQFSEVRKINDKLQGDLDRHRARASPGPQIAELERKVHEACSERDSLNMEVLRLKEELKQKSEPGLNSYDPNSPSALQRKIDELNSQIQDLMEAHDAASEEIHAAERKVKELAGENETLRVTQSDRLRDIEDENRHLKLELQRLKEGHVGHSDATDYRYKIELQQVKEDNRNLRERNYQLHDDNIRAKEELSELRKTIEFMDKKVQKKEDRGRQFDAYERSATDTDRFMKSSYQSDLSYTRLSDPVPDRRTDRERESYSFSRSNYDLQRTEPLRDDREFKEERFTKSDANRYESYRTGPDGGSSDKLLSSLGYVRPLTPERPSALGPPKRESPLMSKSQERVDLSRTFERSDIDFNRARIERSRTTSAEIDLRTTSLAAYHDDLSKTTPALSGRSRAIYNEISDQRSKSKVQTDDANNTNYYTRRLHLAEKVDPAYGRREAKVTHQREALEKQMELLEKQAEKQALLASLPIVTKSGYCDDGNMSDTPTDILVNTAPVEKIAAASWNKGRQRRGSVGSDASNSSFSDIDEQITASVRKRSKSADGREILRRMGPTGSSSKENPSLTRTLSPAPSAGLRSVTLRPIATQHNKSALSLSSSLNSLTQGLRPFAPRSAQDLQISDVIKFSRQGGKLSQGTIKFIGHLPGRGDIYLGVELDKEDGKHDGVFEGIRYFKCKPSKGVFVAYNKVVMAWTSY